jgi:cytochrome b6-f complex iron-sulfur subunit
MARNQNNTASAQPRRRQFLNRLWAFFGLAAAAELGWLGVSFLSSRKKLNKPVQSESIVTAGSVSQFTAGTVTAIPQGHFYLACLADGSFLALSRTCTHLGCSVPWDAAKKQFVCPCHGSTYSMTGEVLSAPAPRPLDIYPVRIENGIVKVNVAAPQRREHFDQEQATRI